MVVVALPCGPKPGVLVGRLMGLVLMVGVVVLLLWLVDQLVVVPGGAKPEVVLELGVRGR